MRRGWGGKERDRGPSAQADCPTRRTLGLTARHSIHDQGAGGASNVLKEIVNPAGGIINIRDFHVGDTTMSVCELWVSEYQEQNALLTKIDGHVDRTSGRVQAVTTRTRKVTQKARQSGMIFAIFVLFLIIIGLLVLVMFT